MEEDKKELGFKRKPGRPSKAEGMTERERSVSVSSVRSMDEYVKRKRVEEGERKRKIFLRGIGRR